MVLVRLGSAADKKAWSTHWKTLIPWSRLYPKGAFTNQGIPCNGAGEVQFGVTNPSSKGRDKVWKVPSIARRKRRAGAVLPVIHTYLLLLVEETSLTFCSRRKWNFRSECMYFGEVIL